jgi:AraC-like DNA-binding protein
MDPLSDVLSLLRPRSQFYAGFDAAGDWSFDFPPHEGIKFTAVIRGACWGATDDMEHPIHFEEGDCFLLNSGCRFMLSSDPSLPKEGGEHIQQAAARDGVAVHNGGGEVFLISGRFAFSGRHAEVLFDALPPIINIPSASSQAGILRWSLDQWASELRDPQPGGTLMSTHLAHLMLVQVLRLFLATSSELPQGWFLAMTDRQISPAIAAIHAEPARRWTLEMLARIAGISRTAFAQRFKALVGSTAMDYLTRWRMLLAADRLRGGRENIASIAFSLGYESESSFSTAFKRNMDCSPTQYRRQSSDSPFDGADDYPRDANLLLKPTQPFQSTEGA